MWLCLLLALHQIRPLWLVFAVEHSVVLTDRWEHFIKREHTDEVEQLH